MVQWSAVLLRASLAHTDERAKLEGELLGGAEVVKCYTWEVRARGAGGGGGLCAAGCPGYLGMLCLVGGVCSKVAPACTCAAGCAPPPCDHAYHARRARCAQDSFLARATRVRRQELRLLWRSFVVGGINTSVSAPLLLSSHSFFLRLTA